MTLAYELLMSRFPLRHEGGLRKRLNCFPLRHEGGLRGMAFVLKRHPPALRATPFPWTGVKA